MSPKIVAYLAISLTLLQLASARFNLHMPHAVYMSEASHCGLYSGTEAQNGKITSHLTYGEGLFPVPYDDASAECYVVIDVGSYAADALVLLRGDGDIKLSDAGSYPTCDQLFVYDGNYTTTPPDVAILGNYSCATTPAASVSNQESTGVTLTVRFNPHNDGNRANGFQFHYSVFRTSASCNNVTEFQCDTDRCIPMTHLCDSVLHCIDGTDEQKATAGCSLPHMMFVMLQWLMSMGLVPMICLGVGMVVLLVLTSISIYCCCRAKKRKHQVTIVRPVGDADA